MTKWHKLLNIDQILTCFVDSLIFGMGIIMINNSVVYTGGINTTLYNTSLQGQKAVAVIAWWICTIEHSSVMSARINWF